MKVIDYPGLNVQDIARMLRSYADDIENGVKQRPSQVVCVAYYEEPQDYSVDVFCLAGDGRPISMLGMLEMAKAEILA